MGKTIVKRAALRVLTLSLVFSSAGSAAEPWDFGLNIDLGVIHTDNVLLAEKGQEERETVLTIAPEFVLSKDSERLQADLRYRPEAYFYSNVDDANDIFHVLDANMVGELVRDRFFLALDAARFQSIVTPDGRFPTSNLPISVNRVDSTTFGIQPYWQQKIGQASLLLEVGFRRVEYDDELYQSSDEGSGHFRLDNIESQQGLAWALDYRIRRMEYELSLPFEFQRASLNLGFWLGGTTRIFVEGGAETSFDNFIDSNMDADFWEAGFQFKPNQRLDLEIAAGDRSYGTSFRGRFAYTLRRGNISVSYDESPSTRSDSVFSRRPIVGTDNLDGLLDSPGSSDRFIRRRGELNTSIELSRSELTVRIFSEKRDLRTTADGTPLPDEDYSGAAIRWSWDMGTKTVLGLGADVSERNQEFRKDNLLRVGADVAFQFSPRLSLHAEAIHANQEGKESSVFDYDENQVRLYLRSEF